MASVQYLIDFNREFSRELQQVQARFSKLTPLRNESALILQRQWKSYATRKRYKQIRFAIITTQRYCRGWQVRKNREKYVQQHAEDMVQLRRKIAATKIEAWWRGTITRIYMRDRLPKLRIAERTRLREASQKMAAYIREVQQRQGLEAGVAEEKRSQAEVKKILYQSRYLLRTSVQEGVCSIHGSDRLSLVETLMKALPCKAYMDDLKKLYEKLSAIPPKSEYTFSTRKLRAIEDLLRTAEQPDEKKSANMEFAKVDKKRFSVSTKIERAEYITSITNGDGGHMLRKVAKDPRLKKLEDNFILSSRKDTQRFITPYYIDFWERNCKGKENGLECE